MSIETSGIMEVSLVTFLANLAAQAVNVKSQDNKQKMLIRAINKGKRCAYRLIYFYLKLIASKGFIVNSKYLLNIKDVQVRFELALILI
ncbi:hypothetical protein [Wolbachia endosymbiont of Mansonella perstans]|uniref:hypothetical protein n=1 Tax=Wolbachia endosymbiont of Mansonella perstans TaxID=229526 RepID=UPI001CE02920|nr:hypothetical protein [Wolbachia endosymbiont of Mansonella perstans]